MKLKGKALLSLLLVLTLVTQLFTVSAAAAGGESLVYALYVQDEYGQAVLVEDEAAYGIANYTVSVGGWALDRSPTGTSLSQLLSETLTVIPPAGFAVEKLWLYGGDSSNPIALPLTAANPADPYADAREVRLNCVDLVGSVDYGTPSFNEQLLSSWSSDNTYTLGILLKRIEGGEIVIYDEYGNVRDYNATTVPGHPGDSGGSAFIGWRVTYENGASAVVEPNSYIQPYANCTLSAAYAPIITLTPNSVTVDEGAWISTVEGGAQVSASNLPSYCELSYANAYVADAADPLTPGAYSLRVGSYSVIDRRTGREVEPSVAVVRCEDGVVTVNAAAVEQWVEPDSGSDQQGGGSGWVDTGTPEVIDLTPSATTVNVTVSDQGWTYTGTPDRVGIGCLSFDPWVEGASFSFTYTDVWGNTTDSIVNAGEYTLNAVYTGGLDASQYNVNVLNSAKVTIYPRTLSVTADSDSKQYDGSALVNMGYSADGLVEGHSLTNVQFSLLDASGNWLAEWPSAEGSYTKVLSGITVVDSYGSDVGGNYDIRLYDGTLTITAPPAPQTTAVTASLGDQSLAYTGAAQNVNVGNVQLEPWVEGAGFAITYVDANGQSWDSVTSAGTYTMQLAYTGGLDASLYTVSIGSVGTLTVTPAALSVSAVSASKSFDGAALVNTEYTASGLLEGHSFREGDGVQFSVMDASGSWLDAWPSNPGSYTKVVTAVHVVDGSGNEVTGNYSLSTANASLTITEVQRTAVTATLSDQSLAYTGAAQNVDPANIQLDPAVSGAVFAISYVDANGQVWDSVTNAGTYTMQLAYTGGLDENAYTVTVGSVGSLTVTRAALSVSADSASKTYDGTALINNNYTATGLLEGHSFREGDGVVFTLTNAEGSAVESAVSVGSYTKAITAVHIVDGSGSEVTDNYSVTMESGTLSIAAAERQTVTVTVPERSLVYDGEAHRFDASILTIEPVVEGLRIDMSILDQNGQTLESVTEVGSYTLQASYAGGLDPNLYEVQIANSAALTVTPCTLTVTAASASKTYDGTALQNTEFTASALLAGHHFRENDPVDFVVKDANGNPIEGWPVQQGVYTKTASAVHVLDGEGRDVSQNYALSAVDGALTVSAPEIVNVTVIVSNQTWAYDGQPHTPKGDEYTVQGLRDSDTLNVTLKAAQPNGTELESVTEVGSYVIKANVSGYDANKYHVTVQAGTLSVTPYGLTATAESATKNFDGKALENAGYTLAPGLLSGHRIAELRFKLLAPNGALMQTWPTEQGVYTKQIGSIKIADASGNDVTKNYQIKLVDGTLTINTGARTARAFLDNNGNQLRGAGDYKFSRNSASGLSFHINADPTLLKSVLVDNGELPNNIQYYTVRSGSTIVTLQPGYLNTLTIGSHMLQVEFTDNGYATTSFTVAEATLIPLQIKGKNVSMAYNGNAYTPSANDLSASISSNYTQPSIQPRMHLSLNGSYVSQATQPGVYDIYLDGLTFGANTPASNYSVTIVDSNGYTVATNYQNTSVKVGTLTIEQSRSKTQVRVTVKDQSWTYDGTSHTLDQTAYTVEGMQSGDPITVKLSIIDANGRTLSAVTDAGTYSIKADVSGYDSGRYTVTTAGVGTLNVNAYKLTLTAVSDSKTYDGTVLRNGNVKATGLLNGHKFRTGDGVKFSVYDSRGNLIQNGPVDVGTYTKKVTEVHIVDANNIEVTANYDITRVDGTLTIQQGNGSPKTGDQNRIGIWIGLLAVSAVLVIVVAVILLRRSMKPRRKPQTRAEARARIRDDEPRRK